MYSLGLSLFLSFSNNKSATTIKSETLYSSTFEIISFKLKLSFKSKDFTLVKNEFDKKKKLNLNNLKKVLKKIFLEKFTKPFTLILKIFP